MFPQCVNKVGFRGADPIVSVSTDQDQISSSKSPGADLKGTEMMNGLPEVEKKKCYTNERLEAKINIQRL